MAFLNCMLCSSSLSHSNRWVGSEWKEAEAAGHQPHLRFRTGNGGKKPSFGGFF